MKIPKLISWVSVFAAVGFAFSFSGCLQQSHSKEEKTLTKEAFKKEVHQHANQVISQLDSIPYLLSICERINCNAKCLEEKIQLLKDSCSMYTDPEGYWGHTVLQNDSNQTQVYYVYRYEYNCGKTVKFSLGYRLYHKTNQYTLNDFQYVPAPYETDITKMVAEKKEFQHRTTTLKVDPEE
jgi:hypothetical protein